MTRKVNEKEFNSVISLPGDKRYLHFIKVVADTTELWMIGDENGIATYSDNENKVIIPVWPHEIYAKACCVDEFANYTPESISLNDWIEDWLSEMEEVGQLIAVFPTPHNKGIVVDVDRFTTDMEDELEKYG
jgi:hypothetical protein